MEGAGWSESDLFQLILGGWCNSIKTARAERREHVDGVSRLKSHDHWDDHDSWDFPRVGHGAIFKLNF